MSRATFWDSPEAIYAPTMDMVRYELQRMSAEIYFAPEVLHGIHVEPMVRGVGEGLAFKIVGAVATWRRERMLEVPANWWQHFKQRWFPRWALKRWPVLVKTYDAAVVLPRVPVVNPAYHTVEFPVWQERPES